MTTTAALQYATGDQIDDLASAYTAFASFLLEERELAPVPPFVHQVSCYLPDKTTLDAFAASLGLPVTRMGSQWRARKTFGPLTYVLWTGEAGNTGGTP